MKNEIKPQVPSGGPRGDTGHGSTGVPDDKQGMSNRPGDRDEEKKRESAEDQDQPRS